MWSLTLPQVAATLAATLVAYRTFNAAGQPLLDSRMLNATLRIAHVGTGTGSPRSSHKLQLTGV
jgi:hypothetical protein